MSLDEFNFISYNKITNQSDAFITSDELNCYVQYVPSSKALSHKIKKEAHTAGTTNDVNDYKIPDISRQLNPKKLYRINPFHKNSSEFFNPMVSQMGRDPNLNNNGASIEDYKKYGWLFGAK